ncbi:angiotensin-converting enzyme [Anabrus simplex]|uniref:angiotensin-converting enzyme n=1 Tax=Anabrus simplex TaxID=316456 RepID=UPI0035A327B5
MGCRWRVLCWLLAVLVSCAANPIQWTEFQVDQALTDMELDRFEYEDKCNTLAQAEWEWLRAGAPMSGSLPERKREAEEEFATAKRFSSKYLHKMWSIHSDIPERLAEEMDMEGHPGDELLSPQLYRQKLNYSDRVAALYQSTKIPCYRNSASCQMGIHDVRRVLAQSGDIAELQHTWRHWHTAVKEGVDGYVQQLQLVREAAVANEAENPTTYWMNLQDLEIDSSKELSYERAEEFWEEIKPLYTKLHQYVAGWLRHQLLDSSTGSILPAHMLGSLLGEDWSVLADLVLPPDDSTFKDIQKGLSNQGLAGKLLYNEAIRTMNEIGLQKLPERFWKGVHFNGTCPPKTVRFCDDEGTVKFTSCSEIGWIEYLDAHEVVATVVLNHLAVNNNKHILRQTNRYSALMDAIPGVVSLLAASPARLNQLNLLPKNTNTNTDYDEYGGYSDHQNPAVLLLVALRTLPRLPYYLAADKWRLDMLANNATNTSSWSKFRAEYQMIKADDDEGDISFLSDPHLLSNRPYLSKFFATVLQFQLLDYFSEGDQENPLAAVKAKDELGTMMTKSLSGKWPDVIQELLNINYISTEALLEYFSPLEKLLEKSVKENDPKVTRRVVEITTPRPTPAPDMSADVVGEVVEMEIEMEKVKEEEEEPRDQPPSTPKPELSTESLVTKLENIDINATLSSSSSNITLETEVKKGSSEASTAILIASLVVFALAVTAGVLVAARRCYKRKYQRNRRPTTER